jgi:hypothetical protein
VKIDLGVPELFDDLLEIEIEDQFVDLHNNFTCVNISYNANAKEVKISFIADDLTEGQSFSQVEIMFSEAEVNELNFPLDLEGNGLCLDSFYRGRIEQNNNLFDKTPDGRYLFYLDFYEGQSLEILAEKLVVECFRKRS